MVKDTALTGNKAAYAAMVAGILCLIPYPYIPPIGSNNHLMILWPIFGNIALGSGIIGVITERRRPEAGGRLESWLGLAAGAGMGLITFLIWGIQYFFKDGYLPQFEFINKIAGNIFMAGPFMGGAIAVYALIRAVKSIKAGRDKIPAYILAAAGLFGIIMALWYGYILIDAVINPKTLG